MKEKDIYRSGYGFAKEQHDRNIKILKIVSLILPLIIIGTFCVTFILSTSFFKSKDETLTQLVPDDPAVQEKKKADFQKEQEDLYLAAGIPYRDPQNRFYIEFTTPYISSDISVVINSEKDYDKVKTEADALVAKAKKQISITSVTYINGFDTK
jgi:hypothetical protein